MFKFFDRLTRESGRYKDELDIMKYICKDLWVTVYKKQIDNLRTNHQGVYVLHDNRFRFLSHMAAGKQYLEYAPRVSSCRILCLVISGKDWYTVYV